MKWYHKVFLIPLAIFIYFTLVDIVSSGNIFSSSNAQTLENGWNLQIGIGQAVGVSVTRAYFFGLVRLPIFSSTLGDIGAYHTMFFNLMYLLTAAVILSIAADFTHIDISSKIFGKKKIRVAKKPSSKRLINKRK